MIPWQPPGRPLSREVYPIRLMHYVPRLVLITYLGADSETVVSARCLPQDTKEPNPHGRRDP